jgi:hypothetical protein
MHARRGANLDRGVRVPRLCGFDVDRFAGERGVFFDAKGGSGDPEPRLGWTRMGSFTVEHDVVETDDDDATTDDDDDSAPIGPADVGDIDDVPRDRVAPSCSCGGDPTPLLALAFIPLRRRRRDP